jgi:thiamine biosynthesis lipoprotein
MSLLVSPVRCLNALALGTWLVAAGAHGEPLGRFEYRQVHMGVPVRILLHAADEKTASAAAHGAFGRIAALDRMMSDYRPDSELRGLQRAGHAWTEVSPELIDVLETALTVARASDGAFDPTVGPLVGLWRDARTSGRLPDAGARDAARRAVGWQHVEIDRARRRVRLARAGMGLDLGGVAKGYILQEALASLGRSGVDRALIEAGGDIVAGAAPPGTSGWRVDAPGADATFRARASALTHAALATSGSTEQFVEIDGVRYSHIVDPRTGLGVTHLALARVIAPDAALADALATALVVADAGARQRIVEQFPGAIASVSGQ